MRRVQAEHFDGDKERLRMGLGLRGPAFSSIETTVADFAVARELGMPISIHVGMAGFPGAIDALAKAGLLGPDVNFAHANQLTDDEFGLIASSGGTITVSPASEMLMALGTFPATGVALRHHIPVGLGADTITATGTDLFSEMRIGLAAERARANADAVAREEAVAAVELDQRDMVALATLGGARALWMDEEVGSLAPGKRADVTVVDLRGPHLDGFGDPLATLVMGAGAADVETVIVDGAIVKEAGHLVEPLASRARELMRASRDRLR